MLKLLEISKNIKRAYFDNKNKYRQLIKLRITVNQLQEIIKNLEEELTYKKTVDKNDII